MSIFFGAVKHYSKVNNKFKVLAVQLKYKYLERETVVD